MRIGVLGVGVGLLLCAAACLPADIEEPQCPTNLYAIAVITANGYSVPSMIEIEGRRFYGRTLGTLQFCSPKEQIWVVVSASGYATEALMIRPGAVRVVLRRVSRSD